jgi:transketolase
MASKIKLSELEKKAWELRLTILRMFSFNKAHHFGGSFSCADLVAALYYYKMNYNHENYHSPDRDRFIMSKGHSVPAQYAALAEIGIIPAEDLAEIKQLGSKLQGHPDVKKTAGLEAPTGSLGQGLSYANGIALGGKFDQLKYNIYLILGDGEIQEGQIWEAAMTTSQYNLNNITAIIDANKFQSQGSTADIMNIEPLSDKFEAFGWHSIRINGHDMKQICDALDEAGTIEDKPVVIIADTIKGKGISFIEDSYKYHNYSLSEDQFAAAEKEILAKLSSLGDK